MKLSYPFGAAIPMIAGILMALPAPAAAYKIIKPRLHEAVTLAAHECWQAAKARGVKPTDCRAYRARVAQLSPLQWSLTYEQREVRWPDDPRREIKSLGAIRAWFDGDRAGCENKIKRRGRALHRIALFCASHYGDLQFLHAMADTPGNVGEGAPAERTREKMLAWASFAYDVASRRVASEANYCLQFSASSPIRDAMVPNGFPYCSTGSRGWTVGEFFSLRCGRLLIWESCSVLGGSVDFVPTVATGALLHLVQDSFSQSHAVRSTAPEVDAAGTPLPRVECGRPRSYFTYTKETKKAHPVADYMPTWKESCDDGARHDILTASAMIFHHLEARTSTEEFVRYLSEKVF